LLIQVILVDNQNLSVHIARYVANFTYPHNLSKIMRKI